MLFIATILASFLAVFPFGTIAEAVASTGGPTLFSHACVAWHLSASRHIGWGWVLSGFCKNSTGPGIYTWDDSNLLDGCIGVDDNGVLIHSVNGYMSRKCAECNNNNGWGFTSATEHHLVCNCTNAHDDVVKSNIDLDAVYGYYEQGIGCLPPPAWQSLRAVRDLHPFPPFGHATVAPAPTTNPTLSLGGPAPVSSSMPFSSGGPATISSSILSNGGLAPVSSSIPFSNGGPAPISSATPVSNDGETPISSATPLSNSGPVPVSSSTPSSNGGASFVSNCNPRFQVTGNIPHPGSSVPRVMWAKCVNNQGVQANTSLDLGLCFGVSQGVLFPEKFGFFNETCFNCVQDMDVQASTLLCHCQDDPVFNKSTTYNATTIPIEPTIQVIDGVLSCFGLHGDRGFAAPSEFIVADWTVPAVNEDRLLPAETSPDEGSKHATRQPATEFAPRTGGAPQDHCCFWDSCSHTLAMRQPEPWLFTRCHRTNDDNPMLIARFDLSMAFMYDRNDWSIKPGDGLYDDGCKDCHTGGSWMYCQCPQADGTMAEKSIDLNEHISNINGTLCSSSYCGDHEAPTAPIKGLW